MEISRIPKFENESDEAEWAYKNREELAEAFLKAAKAGRVRQDTAQQRGITPPTAVRLASEDISRARALAERRGLRYQTYLKMLIHEALEREEKAS
jgi:predicted DNA binding CopG/RHH family protein